MGYGRCHDIAYRIGLVTQLLGASLLAVLYPLESPFYTVGILMFNAGALLSGIYLLVWMSWVKKIILGSILIGIPLQVLGWLYAPEQYAVSVILAGLVPLLFATGAGSDVMKRIAAPMIGGIFTSFLLELNVYPAIYQIWKWNCEVKKLRNDPLGV